MNSLARCLVAVAIIVLHPCQVRAQAHQQEFGRYLLYSKVMTSSPVPQAGSGAERGIPRTGNHGVLTVTVMEKGPSLRSVPAKVRAYAIGVAGLKRPIDMRETKAGDWVSYRGKFSFAPREVLRFEIVAEPEGSGETLDMRYRERLEADRQAP